ncbi:ATP-dependent Clp protease adaptor ClpS [Maribellus sp. CM-23]|uniref:ATP-dependent Clp protease adaptor ClpS n=1 Tax=Maribellus sp. CM-23 TaxID=2781026 RepID=UPI001F4327C5|nr:ATP-dependent Clp protease adaptor ClpS [Maribellus sp. CM-23]MCE4564993.1 ATP-dependent Clp protease adaptor ClpS [Maribellus sp. CM-23]
MTLKEPKNIPVDKSNEETLKENSLILYNDDVHTFDYVIDALIDICEHEIEQATQCTYLVHYKGKCDVKKGSFSELKPMKDALIGRELNATID